MIKINSNEINQFKTLTSRQEIQMFFSNVTSPEYANNLSLVFISNSEMASTALKNQAMGFIILDKIFETTKHLFSPQHCLWTTPQINAAMTEVLTAFDKKNQPDFKIHSTAIVHPKAKIGLNVTISEYAVIQADVIIADHCWIGAHSVIETASQVGKSTRISSHVVIGCYSQIGSNCRIASHCTIASDGFGFYTDRTYTHHRVPQIGTVVIEDNCELGSHCSVDRATLTETRIKAGSKLDNFCHIAHNTVIGENAMLAAGFMTAGSTTTGKNLTTGGGVHLNGHIKVSDNVMLAGNTGVVSSIDSPGVYGGLPQVPQKDNLRIMASLVHLPKLRKQVSAIMKHLGLDKDS